MSHLRIYLIQLADIPYLGSIRVLCMDGMPVYHIPAVLTEMPDLALYVLQTVYMHFRLMEEMIQSFLLELICDLIKTDTSICPSYFHLNY